MPLTTTDLLNSVKRKSLLPESASTFSDADILDIASELIKTDILPMILKSRGEFYVFEEELTLSRDGDKPYIQIPYRAVGRSIVGLKEPDSDEDLDPMFYYVQGNRIIFYSIVNNSSVVCQYHLRPGNLVQTSEVGTISHIDRSTGIVTLLSTPTSFTTSQTYDVISAKTGETYGIDISCSNVAAPYITFTSADIPADANVGDYICLSDESPLPQIPEELHPYLTQLVVCQILEGLGDAQALQAAERKMQKLEQNALSMISPRVQNKGKAIVRPFN